MFYFKNKLSDKAILIIMFIFAFTFTKTWARSNIDGVSELMENGLYFSSWPIVREDLKRNNLRSETADFVLSQVIFKMGAKHIESILSDDKNFKTNGLPSLKYIWAKILFKKGQYEAAIKIIRSMPEDSSIRALSYLIEGSALVFIDRPEEAFDIFADCINKSNKSLSRAKTKSEKRILEVNKDYCLVGAARILFSQKQFVSAYLAYLDLSKESYIWPEILLEEAWNSYYLRDFNRTLGKLVTYHAPFLRGVFYPEAEVLLALTYLRMCLWGDVKRVVDEFYSNFEDSFEQVKKYMSSVDGNHQHFYKLAIQKLQGKYLENRTLDKIIDSIVHENAFNEMRISLEEGENEENLVGNNNSKVAAGVNPNNIRKYLSFSLNEHRRLMGEYVLDKVKKKLKELDKAFKDMSYIKLEVLAHEKKKLYAFDERTARERGDVKFLKRNEKQYFWTFNGEFWADELGDYVFALGSECE
ncbi:MAG: hypothetical protein HQK49_10290 [Oligoflexia bacterium]|nr:hypothetical protein [Oligoflexia bacterium]